MLLDQPGQYLGLYHSIHISNKSPEGYRIILHYSIDWGEKVAHSLDVAKVSVILVISKEHILHLLHVDIGTRFGKRRVGIGVGNILPCK